MKNKYLKHLFLTGLLALGACTGVPDGIEPVSDFDLQRYLGNWYEIARLDHRFERGLSNVRATYRPRDEAGIEVINQGYEEETGQWQRAEGKAFFVSDENTGHLKVSFFGPFYGSYVIFELDEFYRYAMITGNDRSYLWILSRTPEISDDLRDRLLKRAEDAGFDTDKLIFVKQDRQPDQ